MRGEGHLLDHLIENSSSRRSSGVAGSRCCLKCTGIHLSASLFFLRRHYPPAVPLLMWWPLLWPFSIWNWLILHPPQLHYLTPRRRYASTCLWLGISLHPHTGLPLRCLTGFLPCSVAHSPLAQVYLSLMPPLGSISVPLVPGCLAIFCPTISVPHSSSTSPPMP